MILFATFVYFVSRWIVFGPVLKRQVDSRRVGCRLTMAQYVLLGLGEMEAV